MQILALSGSTRPGSFNTALLQYLRSITGGDIALDIMDQLQMIPAFVPQTQPAEFTEQLAELFDKAGKADGILIASPEYAHGIPGVLKNALDWLVDCEATVLKPVAVMGVSTSALGGFRSQAALIQVLTAMNWHVQIEACLCVPYAKRRFDEAGTISDSLTRHRLSAAFESLIRGIRELRG